ncbi:MAG TPA: hypothetical protein VHW24_23625 [Bryobacteraceae bacterium]|nr:hypothetical protein [Bryobacteraceae bacterium]
MTQKTAWFMLQRIRLASQDHTHNKLAGEVEVDETFIGGKARNMHAAGTRRKDPWTRAGWKDHRSGCSGAWRNGSREDLQDAPQAGTSGVCS